jgi:hypothetical protein
MVKNPKPKELREVKLGVSAESSTKLQRDAHFL